MAYNNLTLPSYAHGKAVIAALMLHASIAAWAMQPSKPVAIPTQQVIQVAMVAPSSIAQPAIKPVEEVVEKISDVPPKPEGMKKFVENQEVKPPKKKIQEEKKIQEARNEKMTSGKESPDSTLEHSAVTEPVFDAAYLKNRPPSYPEYARRRGIEGKVLLEVLVSTQGSARNVEVIKSSGYSVLDKVALNSVEEWQFVPAKRGSKLVEATVNVPIVFSLKR